ncbi:unnamed protein product [Prorocentrum cordatum]|uniref:Uncharacterized protein n=1 Tax=Prorocentrum cordatum TaxID=2364126 RepID=A0ABN9XB39_9DINO|nr:unnamed protein product [Polarella glacialis]
MWAPQTAESTTSTTEGDPPEVGGRPPEGPTDNSTQLWLRLLAVPGLLLHSPSSLLQLPRPLGRPDHRDVHERSDPEPRLGVASPGAAVGQHETSEDVHGQSRTHGMRNARMPVKNTTRMMIGKGQSDSTLLSQASSTLSSRGQMA